MRKEFHGRARTVCLGRPGSATPAWGRSSRPEFGKLRARSQQSRHLPNNCRIQTDRTALSDLPVTLLTTSSGSLSKSFQPSLTSLAAMALTDNDMDAFADRSDVSGQWLGKNRGSN